MPRAYFSFTLPQELNEYKIAHNASSYYCALLDFAEKIRQMRKYENKKSIKVEEVEKIFWDIIKDRSIDFDN
jgi:hypothetical protein